VSLKVIVNVIIVPDVSIQPEKSLKAAGSFPLRYVGNLM
jgi:hypothetical protein